MLPSWPIQKFVNVFNGSRDLEFLFIKKFCFKPFLNCDGLKNEYNDNMYEYEDRSVYTCNATTECPSK